MLEEVPEAFRAFDFPTPYLAQLYSGADVDAAWRDLSTDLNFLRAKMTGVRVSSVVDGLEGDGLPLTLESFTACRAEPRGACDQRRRRAHVKWYLGLVDDPSKTGWVKERINIAFVEALRGVDLHSVEGIKAMMSCTQACAALVTASSCPVPHAPLPSRARTSGRHAPSPLSSRPTVGPALVDAERLHGSCSRQR